MFWRPSTATMPVSRAYSCIECRRFSEQWEFNRTNIQPTLSLVELRLPLAAPTWLWGRCSRHNSPPASSVMDLVFRRSDGSHVSVDTGHPYLLRSSSFSSPRWYHLQSLSSDIFLVSPLYVAKPPQSCFPAPLCYVLYFQSLPGVIVFHMVSFLSRTVLLNA